MLGIKVCSLRWVRYIGVLCLCVPGLAQAVSYECLPKAIAGVEHTNTTGQIDANLYQTEGLKLTLTQTGEDWQLWENSDREPIFAQCQSQYRCEPEQGFYGVFYMTKQHIFTYIIQKAYGPQLERQIVFTYKGRCHAL
jgi:hypothetical protein